MSKKKKTVTAPLSYDPGKGRPKEYLAYLNWQEMEALKRLNGNNMERGPMGLPSFPPDWGGTENSTGNWSGAGNGSVGGTTGGSSDSGGSDSGGSVGGVGAGTATGTTTAASPSTTATSETADTQAQQAATMANAAEAARASAVAEDAAKGGIGSLNVGPMQTPVQIGSGAISQAAAVASSPYSSVTPTMPGGGGMGQYNARAGSLTTAVGPTSGIDAFNNIATGSLYGTPPSAARAYDSLESDLNRRALARAMDIESTAPSITPNAPGGVFGPRLSMDRTYYPDAPSGATVGPRQYSAPSLFESDRYTSEFDGIGGPTDRQMTEALKNAVYNTYSTISDYFSGEPSNSAYDVNKLPQLETIAPEVRNAQSLRVMGGAGIASLPGSPGSLVLKTEPGIDSVQRDITYGGGPTQVQMANIDRMGPFNTAHDLSRERVISVENVPDVYEGGAEQQISNVEEYYREQPGVEASVIPSKYGYPTKPDGTPYTAEDLQNLPPEVLSEYMDKVRFARQTDEPYPLTDEQRVKSLVAKGIGRVAISNPLTQAFVRGVNLLGEGIGLLPGAVGQVGDEIAYGSEQLMDPGESVANYERANPLRKEQMASLAGKSYLPGSATNYASGTPSRELGGKQDPFFYLRNTTSPYQTTQSTRRMDREKPSLSELYLLWDKGVGIPSPGEPGYNEYQKYLRENKAPREA